MKVRARFTDGTEHDMHFEPKHTVDIIMTEILARMNVPKTRKNNYLLIYNEETVLDVEFKKLTDADPAIKDAVSAGQSVPLALLTPDDAKDFAKKKKADKTARFTPKTSLPW